MTSNVTSECLTLLKDRFNLRDIPLSERGSRLLIFHADHRFTFRLAERWPSGMFIDLAIQAAREKSL